MALFDPRRSSSVHRLSGDAGLKRPLRPIHDALNWANNRFPRSYLDGRLVQRPFRVPASEADWGRITGGCSPLRALCDLFWIFTPWSQIREALGRLDVLDIGCGAGYCLDRIQELTGVRFDRYTGVDIHPHPAWEAREKNRPGIAFRLQGEGDPLQVPPGTTLILSQSALEHVVSDLEMIRSISAHVSSADHPVLQIHQVPAAATLWLYRYHGVRQYTPRTLSRLTREFSDATRPVAYAMGGAPSVAVHEAFIHPLDRRESDRDRYIAARRDAIEAEFDAPVLLADPINYGLILMTRMESDPFEAVFSR